MVRAGPMPIIGSARFILPESLWITRKPRLMSKINKWKARRCWCGKAGELLAACEALVSDYDQCISASEFGDGCDAEKLLDNLKVALAKTHEPPDAPPKT